MSHGKTIALTPLLRKFLESHIDQEQKDNADPDQTRNRVRTLWEVAAPLVIARLRVPGISVDGLRLHLVYLKYEGIHWPRFAGKTGQEFQDEFRAAPLGGVQEATPLSIELAQLDREGMGQQLVDRLRPDYREEIEAILNELRRHANAWSAKPITWQQAAERMKRLCNQGLPFTSQHKLADDFACSPATINKAIENSPELHAWAKQPEGNPRAQSVSEVVIDRAPQSREPNPEDDAAFAELQKLVEADSDERAFIDEMHGASRRFQFWYLHLSKNGRAQVRKDWRTQSDSDAKIKPWFFGLPAEEQVAYFDDSDKYPKVLGRKP